TMRLMPAASNSCASTCSARCSIFAACAGSSAPAPSEGSPGCSAGSPAASAVIEDAREVDDELSSALVCVALGAELDRAVLALEQLAHDEEAEAPARAARLAGNERVEQRALDRRLDAWSIVAHSEPRGVEGDRHLTRPDCLLFLGDTDPVSAVEQEVVKNLRQPPPAAQHDERRVGTVSYCHINFLLLPTALIVVGNLADQLADIDLLASLADVAKAR